jgi:hypothetical protein
VKLLGTGPSWVVNFTPRPLRRHQRARRYPLGWSQRQSSCSADENKKIPCPSKDSNCVTSGPQPSHYTDYATPNPTIWRPVTLTSWQSLARQHDCNHELRVNARCNFRPFAGIMSEAATDRTHPTRMTRPRAKESRSSVRFPDEAKYFHLLFVAFRLPLRPVKPVIHWGGGAISPGVGGRERSRVWRLLVTSI